MKFNIRKVYIALFAVLYFCVGLVSTIHSVAFFSLANALWLGIILACTFEVGQAAVLFSILTDHSGTRKIMPWVLMCVLTLVQILGNVFSSYKYLISNSADLLRYFKEPIFVWMPDIPDQQCNVILTYIIGAILPVVALCMTSMLEKYLNNETEAPTFNFEDEDIEEETVEEVTTTVEPTTEIPTTEAPTTLPPTTIEPVTTTTTTEQPVSENPVDYENQRQSHFINLK